MGACCSGFRIRKPEGVSVHQTQNIIHALLATFIGVNRNEQSDAPESNYQASAPLNSDAASNSIQSDNVVTLAPSVLLCEGDTACSRENKENLRIKIREDDSKGDKPNGLQCEGSESESKVLEAEVACGSSEGEDVCPTCLEEYEPENPRTVLQCSHSYHLGCIYEWMERSANCPICGKMMMIFDEAA